MLLKHRDTHLFSCCLKRLSRLPLQNGIVTTDSSPQTLTSSEEGKKKKESVLTPTLPSVPIPTLTFAPFFIYLMLSPTEWAERM